MTLFTDRFGGSVVQSSDVQFVSVALSTNITTAWPPYATGVTQVLGRIMKVSASAPSLTISLPDATLASQGQDVLFDNSGANTFTVLDFSGNVIATLAAGQVKYIYLSDASTQAGVWRVNLFGVGSSTLDASALAGLGLKAISNTIVTAAVATVIGGNTVVVMNDRSKIFIWTGATGTLTLPTTVGSTSDFVIEVKNQGTGTLTIAPVGGVLIDGSGTITLSVQESCFVHMGATDWYTVGRGRNTAFNFTQLAKSTTGGTTTLTLTEASNVVQKYTGALVSNATITLPAVVQVYYVNNLTTGAYTLTFGCAGGGTSISVAQGQAAILFCDSVNIINANTSLAGGITAIVFAAGTVSAPPVAIAESTTGFYSTGTHEIGVSINGVYAGKWTSSGFTAVGTITATTFVGTVTGGEVTANKNASGGYAGLTLFKLNMVNVAGTFTSFQTNTNTAVRTYTWPDVTGNTVVDSAATNFTAQQYFGETTLTYNATQTWAVAANQVTKVTLTGNATFSAPTGQVAGACYSLLVIQDGTGSRTGAWNTVFKFANGVPPVLSTGASAKDLFNFRSDGTNMLEIGRTLGAA